MPTCGPQWRDRLDHCAGDDGRPPSKLAGLEQLTAEANPPEFGFGRPYQPQPTTYDGPPGSLEPDNVVLRAVSLVGAAATCAGGDFIAERTSRRSRPGPALAASQRPDLGHGGRQLRPGRGLDRIARRDRPAAGNDAPELGRRAADLPRLAQAPRRPVRELPRRGGLPRQRRLGGGTGRRPEVHSERGATCRLYSPWPGGLAIVDEKGTAIATTTDEYGRTQFPTRSGITYRIAPTGR